MTAFIPTARRVSSSLTYSACCSRTLTPLREGQPIFITVAIHAARNSLFGQCCPIDGIDATANKAIIATLVIFITVFFSKADRFKPDARRRLQVSEWNGSYSPLTGTVTQ